MLRRLTKATAPYASYGLLQTGFRYAAFRQLTRNTLPTGSIAAPFTPFDKKTGEVILDILPDYVKHLEKCGVPSVFVNGTTGEGLSLTVEERKVIAEAWMNNRQHLDHIMLHIGAANLRDTQKLAEHAESIKADAIACISPSYFKPQTVDALVDYMQQVAERAPSVPFYLYDINFMTGIYLDIEQFLIKASNRIPTLKGIKHTSPELNSILRCHRACGGKYHVLLGSDDTLLPVMAMGIENCIPSGFMAPFQNKIREAFKQGDWKTAQEYQFKCVQISAARAKYSQVSGLFAVSRDITKMIGLDLGPPRLPLQPLSNAAYNSLKNDLEKLNFFDYFK